MWQGTFHTTVSMPGHLCSEGEKGLTQRSGWRIGGPWKGSWESSDFFLLWSLRTDLSLAVRLDLGGDFNDFSYSRFPLGSPTLTTRGHAAAAGARDSVQRKADLCTSSPGQDPPCLQLSPRRPPENTAARLSYVSGWPRGTHVICSIRCWRASIGKTTSTNIWAACPGLCLACSLYVHFLRHGLPRSRSSEMGGLQENAVSSVPLGHRLSLRDSAGKS